jgi:hypothetical protein
MASMAKVICKGAGELWWRWLVNVDEMGRGGIVDCWILMDVK